MSELFQLRLHVTAAGLCLDARGRLDGTTCHRLTHVITAVLDHRAARRVMLGLYAVDAIDLAGIAALRMSHAQAHRHGVELLMCGPQRHVRAAIGAVAESPDPSAVRRGGFASSWRTSPPAPAGQAGTASSRPALRSSWRAPARTDSPRRS
ncbi:STAS domain-containing protein [Catellatospora methionotrophica]|uniref:STAS domain-containing protein n=1 Tax=Catellatospora methionotrophica TaxID=121620 RepID=UPI0033EE6D58